MVKYLLDLGFELTYQHNSALMCALIHSKYEIAEYLIEQGADPVSAFSTERLHFWLYKYYTVQEYVEAFREKIPPSLLLLLTI